MFIYFEGFWYLYQDQSQQERHKRDSQPRYREQARVKTPELRQVLSTEWVSAVWSLQCVVCSECLQSDWQTCQPALSSLRYHRRAYWARAHRCTELKLGGQVDIKHTHIRGGVQVCHSSRPVWRLQCQELNVFCRQPGHVQWAWVDIHRCRTHGYIFLFKYWRVMIIIVYWYCLICVQDVWNVKMSGDLCVSQYVLVTIAWLPLEVDRVRVWSNITIV